MNTRITNHTWVHQPIHITSSSLPSYDNRVDTSSSLRLCFIPHYIISRHSLSSHLISSHIITSYLIHASLHHIRPSSHIISHHIISYQTTTSYMQHNLTYHPIPYHTMSDHHIVSYQYTYCTVFTDSSSPLHYPHTSVLSHLFLSLSLSLFSTG
jgi:hypothetical protein